MNSRSLIQQIKCRWREFRREPSAFFWVVFMPLLWMVVLGIAFSNPRPERYGVGVQDGEHFRSLEHAAQVKLKIGNPEKIDRWFKRGDIVLAIEETDAGLKYRFDPKNPESARARRYINDLLQRQAGRRDVIRSYDESETSEGGRYVDFLIPGLLGFSILSSSLFGVGMTLVSNRKENLLKRYLATPMRKSEFLLSHVFGRLIVLFFEFSAIMLAGWAIFDFKVYGNFFSFGLIAVMGASTFTAFALLCASRTSSIPMIAGMINLITFPMVLMSGVFFSKNNFPDAMRIFIDLLPLTALNDALRKVALEGVSIMATSTELAVLGVYFIVATAAASLTFKWH